VNSSFPEIEGGDDEVWKRPIKKNTFSFSIFYMINKYFLKVGLTTSGLIN
jgi:hypothetical protein